MTPSRGTWMRCAPREPGYYWYRSEVDKPTIVQCTKQGIYTSGTRHAHTASDMLLDNGEFWSLPIEPPKG